jgi:hypothetical protein
MTRYDECLWRVKAYVHGLRFCNPSTVEGLVRSFVEQPAYEVTFRERLVRDALAAERGEEMPS